MPYLAQASTCEHGQLAATQITYGGKLTVVAHPSVPPQMLAHLGVTKRTAFVAEGGFFAEVDEGMNVRPSKRGGQVQIMPNLFISEVPTRIVRIDTPRESLSYDELGRRPGERRPKTHGNEAETATLFKSSYVSNLGSAPTLGKATYAGVPCVVRSVTLFGPDAKFCVAHLRGRNVVLAEDWTDRASGELQTMHAIRVENDVCVSQARFEAPPGIRFREDKTHAADADDENDPFFKDEEQ